MGDTIGHADLPGICIAFMLTGTKAIFPTFLGAMASGLLGVLLIDWIVQNSRIKSDAAMGMILSSFFGMGIFTMDWYINLNRPLLCGSPKHAKVPLIYSQTLSEFKTPNKYKSSKGIT